MTVSRLARFAGALAVSLMLFTAPALAAGQKITIINGLNHDITSFKLRGGTVTGFQKLRSLQAIEVTIRKTDGSCSGWLVARTKYGDAAQILTNVCTAGTYRVTVRPRKNNVGYAADLYIKQVN